MLRSRRAKRLGVLRRDLDAVKQAITSRWSNGPVDGHINRLKMIQAAIYGRAGFYFPVTGGGGLFRVDDGGLLVGNVTDGAGTSTPDGNRTAD
jgi:hypothetical protein